MRGPPFYESRFFFKPIPGHGTNARFHWQGRRRLQCGGTARLQTRTGYNRASSRTPGWFSPRFPETTPWQTLCIHLIGSYTIGAPELMKKKKTDRPRETPPSRTDYDHRGGIHHQARQRWWSANCAVDAIGVYFSPYEGRQDWVFHRDGEIWNPSLEGKCRLLSLT